MKRLINCVLIAVVLLAGCSRSTNNTAVYINKDKFISVLVSKYFTDSSIKHDKFQANLPLYNSLNVQRDDGEEDNRVVQNYKFGITTPLNLLENNYKQNLKDNLEVFYYIQNKHSISNYTDDAVKKFVNNLTSEHYIHGLRKVFSKYSNTIGEEYFKLANLVGFPDPDPTSVLANANTPGFSSQNFLAKNIRNNINQTIYSRDVFWSEYLTRSRLKSENIIENYQKSKSINYEKINQMIYPYIEKSSTISNSIKKLKNSDPKNIDITLAELKSLELNSVNPPIISKKINQNQDSCFNIDSVSNYAENSVLLWCKLNNYQLSEDADNVTDRTDDLIAWYNNKI